MEIYKHKTHTSYKYNTGMLLITAIGLIIRFLLFPIISGDYRDFLKPWFDEIASGGGFQAIGQPIGDYLPSYIYILASLTYLPINSLYTIKMVSCLSDIVLAVYCFKTAYLLTKDYKLSTLVYSAVFLLPTVIINSAAWGQCDAMFTAALAASVYYFLDEKPNRGMIAFSISFILKLQAVFLLPFIAFLFFKKLCKIRHFLYIPIVYVTAVLPAALAGRQWTDLLTIYFRLAGTYKRLSLNAPNPYAFINTENTTPYSIGGILVCALVLLLGLLYFLPKPTTDRRTLFSLSFLAELIVPFLLPHMHERYFFVADVFSVIYAFLFPNRWYISLAIVISSFLVCGIFLFGFTNILAPICAFLILFALVVLLKDIVRMVNN